MAELSHESTTEQLHTGNDNSSLSNPRVAIVGAGSIGQAFAVVFAKAGFSVALTDPDPERRAAVGIELATKLSALKNHGLLREDISNVLARVSVLKDLETAVRGALLVQECVPEHIDVKRELFRQLARLTAADCVIASSTSFIPISHSAAETGVEHRAIVAHPGNPPYLIPVIELVPSQSTEPEVLERAKALYTHAEMSPVVVNKEVEGFIFNRLQGAILREAYDLVDMGVASVEDVDTVVRDGLGRRWTFMGPFETVDLNTRGGIEAHAQKMGPFYRRICLEQGTNRPWTPSLVAEVARQRRALLPIDEWDERVAWRDNQLMVRAMGGSSAKTRATSRHNQGTAPTEIDI